MGVIESGSRGQVAPDSPQDTPLKPEGGLFVPSRGQVRHGALGWGLAAVVAAVALLSVVVLGSYRGQLAEQASRAAATQAAEDASGAEPGRPQGPAAPGDSDASGATNAPEPPRPVAPPAPAAITVPTRGSGEVRVARYTREAPTHQSGRTIRVRIEVEREMPTDPELAAAQAADVLQDARSWPSKQRVRFKFVGEGSHDLVIRILTPDTTDRRCYPLRTLGEVSCSSGNAVNLNGVRWEAGIPDYGNDLNGYRTYLVNHEVGHYLGLGHVDCPGPGRPAPVMMQQTKGLQGCAPNPWP